MAATIGGGAPSAQQKQDLAQAFDLARVALSGGNVTGLVGPGGDTLPLVTFVANPLTGGNALIGPDGFGKLSKLSFSSDPSQRTIAIAPSGANGETAMVQEPSVWFYGGLYHMLYTGGQGASQNLYYASASSLSGPWTKNGAPVIGGGAAGHATGAYHAFVYLEGASLWCYFVDVADGSLIKVATASANAPTVWTKIGTTYGLPEGMTQLGNTCLLKDDNTYHFMIEGSTPAASWQTAYGTLAGSPIGAFTPITNPITQIRPSAINSTATVSGPQLFKEDGQFVLYYHCGRAASLPTEIYRATSPDMLTWTIANNGYPIVNRSHPAEIDQVADASIVQDVSTGQWSLFYTAMDNTKPAARIMVLRGAQDLAGFGTTRNQRVTDPAKKAVAQLGADLSVSSTTFVDVSGMSIKFIPSGPAVLVSLQGVGTNGTTSAVNNFRVTDGGSITKSLGGYTPPSAGMQFGISSPVLITGLNPGQRYTLKLQAKVSAGAFLCRPTTLGDKELLAFIVEDAEWPLIP